MVSTGAFIDDRSVTEVLWIVSEPRTIERSCIERWLLDALGSPSHFEYAFSEIARRLGHALA